MDHDSRSVFQCFDTALADMTPDVLGLWTTVTAPSPGALAFGTTAERTPEALLWRVNLPAEPHLAKQHLTSAETKLSRAQNALAVATNRLTAFLEAQHAGVAFAPPASDLATAQPEAELAIFLAAAHAGRAPVSFSLGERLSGGWEQAAGQFQAVVERLQRLLAHYVWVETHVQQALLGRTSVSWTGDVETVWRAGLSPEQVLLHQRALAVALHSRDRLLQTLLMAAQFAVKLSALMSLPGGVILALPAAWKFINQVLAEGSIGALDPQI